MPNKHIEEINAEFHREARIDLYLSEKLQGIEELGYDYVIIDCAPERTKVNDAVLCYVDNIVMPIHRKVKITEAGKLGKTVFEYDEEVATQFSKF